jgi:DNA-binding beta-propeller fold protein YncE
VHVINAATNTYVTSFSVGGQPADVAFSPDSKRAYITNLQSGELYVIDTTTNTVIAKPIIDSIDYRYFPEWDYEHEAVPPPTSRSVRTANASTSLEGDDIVVVDTVTYSVIKSFASRPYPERGAQSLTITDDGTIYVTLEDTVVVEVTEPPAYANLALSNRIRAQE